MYPCLRAHRAASLGPVAAAIDASDDIFQHYRSGTLSGKCGTKLDHGVTVVGYTETTYIVKNSWGTTWGDKVRNAPLSFFAFPTSPVVWTVRVTTGLGQL